MKNWLIFLLFLIVTVNCVEAAISPVITYCERQGHQVIRDGTEQITYCKISYGPTCEIWSYYNNTCGIDFKRDLPCRNESEIVFTEFEKCCEGTKPYLPFLMFGQPRCETWKTRIKLGIVYDPWFWVLEILILALIIYFLLKQKKLI